MRNRAITDNVWADVQHAHPVPRSAKDCPEDAKHAKRNQRCPLNMFMSVLSLPSLSSLMRLSLSLSVSLSIPLPHLSQLSTASPFENLKWCFPAFFSTCYNGCIVADLVWRCLTRKVASFKLSMKQYCTKSSSMITSTKVPSIFRNYMQLPWNPKSATWMQLPHPLPSQKKRNFALHGLK